jgi:hypothetical protein
MMAAAMLLQQLLHYVYYNFKLRITRCHRNRGENQGEHHGGNDIAIFIENRFDPAFGKKSINSSGFKQLIRRFIVLNKNRVKIIFKYTVDLIVVCCAIQKREVQFTYRRDFG